MRFGTGAPSMTVSVVDELKHRPQASDQTPTVFYKRQFAPVQDLRPLSSTTGMRSTLPNVELNAVFLLPAGMLARLHIMHHRGSRICFKVIFIFLVIFATTEFLLYFLDKQQSCFDNYGAMTSFTRTRFLATICECTNL